jgi:hypothetical protein
MLWQTCTNISRESAASVFRIFDPNNSMQKTPSSFGAGRGGGGGLASNEDIAELLQNLKVHCHVHMKQTLRGTACLTTFCLIL